MFGLCKSRNFSVFSIHQKRQNSSLLQHNSCETPVAGITPSKGWSCAVPPHILSSFWLLIHHRARDCSPDLPRGREATFPSSCYSQEMTCPYPPASAQARGCMEYVRASDTLLRAWSVLHHILGDLLHFSTFIKHIVLSICIKIIYRLPQNFYGLNQIRLGMSARMFHSCRWKNRLFQRSLGKVV